MEWKEDHQTVAQKSNVSEKVKSLQSISTMSLQSHPTRFEYIVNVVCITFE